MDIYLNTYIGLVAILAFLSLSGLVFVAATLETEGAPDVIGLGVFGGGLILLAILHFTTPTREHMIAHEYNDLLASRPHCSTATDDKVAEISCLREYAEYVVDSIQAARLYYQTIKVIKTRTTETLEK